MTILVTTLGNSWSIIPELIGFTNPGLVALYQYHSNYASIQQQRTEYAIPPVSEIWIVTTCGESVDASLQCVKEGHPSIQPLRLRFHP